MNVLIVEDDPLAVQLLEKTLLKCIPEINNLQQVESVEKAATYIDNNKENLDLAFFNIHLTDGASFEILEKTNFDKPVIFTSSNDQHALRAFKFNSIDYLLKPLKSDELENALLKFRTLYDQQANIFNLNSDSINRLLPKRNDYKQRFLVKIGSSIQFKNVREAALFSAEDKYCFLHTFEGISKKYLIDHTLEELDDNLLDPTKYFRISRQHIININSIKEIKIIDNQHIIIPIISCNNQLIISRGRVTSFKNWLDN